MTWVEEVRAARDAGATFFDFLTAVDRQEAGFEVVVRLWDPVRRQEHLLTTTCEGELPTLTGLFRGAAWHERATAELFGITFLGHDTSPLLLAPGFEGHPLRKDFVLTAREEKPWPGAKDPGESTADLMGPGATPKRRRAKPLGAR